MADELHVIELLPAYALGCLDEGEAARVSEHLARCPDCRRELQGYQAVTGVLALAAPDALPPARLKRRLMRRLGPGSVPLPGLRQQLAALLRRSAPAWSLAGLILIVALAAGNLWLWQRLGRATAANRAGNMQVVAMLSTDAAPEASGRLVVSAGGEYGTLVVDGLPVLDAAHQYQVWLIRDGRRTSGGVFSVNPHGYRAIELTAPEPLITYSSFGVTVEPAGGSPAPTGAQVLAGGF